MKLFLNGGGFGNQTIDTYKEINKILDHNKPILYIPLARESENNYNDCYEWIKEEISVLDIPSIDMVRTFEELSNLDYNKYSMIFIGGGNTYKLLKGIKESKAYNKIIEYVKNNGVIYGSSAGSVIFGKNIDTISIMDSNDVDLEDTSGFDLLNGVSLFVHYTNYRSKYTEEENKTLTDKYTNFLVEYTTDGEKVIAYPEENTVFINDNKIEIIGKSTSYVFENGNKEEFKM